MPPISNSLVTVLTLALEQPSALSAAYRAVLQNSILPRRPRYLENRDSTQARRVEHASSSPVRGPQNMGAMSA